MRLLVRNKIDENYIDCLSYDDGVINSYICFYDFDKKIDEEININFYNRIVKIVNEYSNYDEELVRDCLKLKNNIITFCNENKTNSIISYFDSIEIVCDDIEIFEKLDNILPQTDIPVVINVSELEIDYVHANLREYDKKLKLKCPNIRYIIKYNLSTIEAHCEDVSSSCDDVLIALDKILAIKNKILKYNLSPFEQIMYAYDIIKDKLYKDDDTNYINSRDIVRILNGDSIVCLGYSKLFEAILTELNIKSSIILLANDNTDIGHARNMVVVNDKKYNLNHILFFDITSDARKSNDINNNYLNNYIFFARNISIMNQNDQKHNYRIVNKQIYNIDDTKEEIKNMTTISEAISLILKIRKCWQDIDIANYLETINIDSKYKDELLKILLNNSEFYCIKLGYTGINIFEILKDLYELTIQMLDRKISIEKFTKCLYQVRRVEYYQEPNTYKLNDSNLLKVFLNRYVSDYGFDITKTMKENLMLKYILFDKNLFRETIEEIDLVADINDTKKLENDIERIKLLAHLNELNCLIQKENIDPNTKVADAIMLVKK